MVNRRSAVAYPVAAVFCVVLIPVVIAIVVVLALIPLYLPSKTSTGADAALFQREETFTVPVADSTPLGPLSKSEVAQLLATILSSLNASTFQNATVTIEHAEIVYANETSSDRKRRQRRRKNLTMTIRCIGRSLALVNAILAEIRKLIQSILSAIAAAIANILGNRTSTTLSNPITSTSTVPLVLLSSTVANARQRREVKKKSSTRRPLVTYWD